MAWVSKYKTKDGRTTYKVGWRDPSGRTHKKTFRLRRDADDFARGVEGDKVRGDYHDPGAGKMSLGEYFDHYMVTATHLKPSSRHLYAETWRRYIGPGLGSYPLGAIQPSDVRGFLTSLQDRPATARIAHRLLRGVLYQAVEDRRIRENPAARAKVPRENRRQARYLTAEEVDRLAQEVPHLYQAMIYLMAHGGLRIGECAALRVSDVDFLRGRVHVRRNSVEVGGRLMEGTPKGGAERVVAIPTHVVEGLSRHVRDYPQENDRMFGHELGSVIRQSRFRNKVFAPAVKRAGLAPLRVHDLRHTAVALAVERGAHPLAIKEMAGHASITTTFDIYGHLFPTLQETGNASRPVPGQSEVVS